MHYVYKITNKVNNKIYVGVHSSNDILNDLYMGSGTNISQAVRKYGRPNFSRLILFLFLNADDAYNMEKDIVDKLFIHRRDTYNIVQGGSYAPIDQITVINLNGEYFNIDRDDERYKSGLLRGKNYGKIKVYSYGSDTGILIYPHEVQLYLTIGYSVARHIKNECRMALLMDLVNGIPQTPPPVKKTRRDNKLSKSYTGSKNSQYGTMWIHNEQFNISKKINKLLLIPDG